MNKIKALVIFSVMCMLVLPVLPVGEASAAINYVTSNSLGVTYAEAAGLGNRDIRETVASIIRVALGLLGIIAVVIILIGGFTWMTAGGNEEQVGKAKKWIFSGVIGLAIILSAYALASWVIKELVTATTTG
ncbi:MAG: hypothetical protein ABH832_02430 [bacterium]